MNEKIASISRLNFWDGTAPDLGVRRLLYTDRILAYADNRLVKVLVGQRRAGKSYLMRQLIFALMAKGADSRNFLYINRELMEFDFLQDHHDLAKLVKAYREELKPVGKVYIFVDEIQEIQGWERIINSYSQDFVDQYDLYISGSNAQLLSGELATHLSGRYVEFQIQPFVFRELAGQEGDDELRKQYLGFLQSGGLPELLHLAGTELRRNYVSAVKDTILLKDVVQRFGVKDASLLEDIFSFLINNASNLVSISAIVNYLNSVRRKTHYETVSNYIRYMERAFLVHQVDRYQIKGKEILGGSNKYYVNDLAYKNYLYPGFEYGFGYQLENALFLELLASGYQVFTGVMRSGEVDFVARKDERSLYIQVSWSVAEESTARREYESLLGIPDHHEKYLVTMDEFQLGSNEGIRHLQAWKFHEIL